MMKVRQDDYVNALSGFAAGGRIAYGMFVQRTAAETVKGAAGAAYTYVGVAEDREIEGSVSGFYSQYEAVPIIPKGKVMAWLMGGLTLTTGDFVKLGGGAYGAGTENVGYVIPEGTKTTKTLLTVGKVVGNSTTTGDVGSADYDQVLVSNAAAGDTVLTLDAGKMTSLALTAGDYIVIDSDAAQEVNRVQSVTSTTITLQNPCSAAYTTAAAGTVYKLVQVEIELVV